MNTNTRFSIFGTRDDGSIGTVGPCNRIHSVVVDQHREFWTTHKSFSQGVEEKKNKKKRKNKYLPRSSQQDLAT